MNASSFIIDRCNADLSCCFIRHSIFFFYRAYYRPFILHAYNRHDSVENEHYTNRSSIHFQLEEQREKTFSCINKFIYIYIYDFLFNDFEICCQVYHFD